MLEYEKLDGNPSEIIQKHEEDSIKLNKFNKEKRKYFKYEKVSYI